MNKVILGLILAVCLLGMALVMLNERLGRQTESANAPASSLAANKIPADLDFPESPVDVNPPLPAQSVPDVSPLPEPDNAARAEGLEEAEAGAALAPPPAAERPQEPAKTKTETQPRPAPVAKAAPVSPKAPEPDKPMAEKPNVEKPAPEKAIPIEKAPTASSEKNKEKAVNRFVIFSREKGATIRIGGTQRIHYNSMTLDNPDRIVVDMDGQWQFPPSPGVPKNELVSNVRIGKNGEKTRVVIDLKEKARVVRIIPSKNGDSMDIRVDK